MSNQPLQQPQNTSGVEVFVMSPSPDHTPSQVLALPPETTLFFFILPNVKEPTKQEALNMRGFYFCFFDNYLWECTK